jgi:hypothetical protein
MDFYEELGVSPLASEIEIRQSYKRLTLLLHPDQQQNPELRALAEGQMKRLNEMAEILTDPERRRAYNQSLCEKIPVVRQSPPTLWSYWIRGNRGWIFVALAFVIVVISALVVPTFDSARSAATVHEPLSGAAQPASHRVSEMPGLASSQTSAQTIVKKSNQRSIDPPTPGAELKPAPALPTTPTDANSPIPDVERPVFQAPVVPLVRAGAPEVSATAPPQTVASAPTLAGSWVYTPNPGDSVDSKLFPAEYVELSIVLSGNTLHGAYRSRYKLSDRRLNPHVNFTFGGSVAATSFIWTGDSGAQGEISIRLKSADTLMVYWFATAMGSALSLSSGNATLYRFR